MTPWKSHHTWSFDNFVYDVTNNSLWVRDVIKCVPLERKTQQLLSFLLREAVRDSVRVVPREEVAAAVWPELEYGPQPNTIDRRISQLRKKLQREGDPDCPYVSSVKKHGLRFALPVAEEKPLGIMVMPFKVMHSQSYGAVEAEDFGWMVRDALSRRLTMNPGLRVHRYEDSEDSPSPETVQEVREKGVEKLLIGSAHLSPKRVRVTMHVIGTDDVYEQSPEPLEYEAKDLCMTVERVAARLEEALKVSLTKQALKAVSQRKASNAKAEQLYSYGRVAWARHVPEGLKTAVEMYRAAIELDPTFALPYSGMAEVFFHLAAFGNEVKPPREVMPQSESMARKALSLNPNCVEAQTMLATVQMVYHWDAKASKRSFLQALEMNPDYGQAHHFYANSITATGDFETALQEIDIAHALDFKDLKTASSYAWIYYFAGDYEETIRRCRDLVRVAPGYPLSHAFLGLALIQVGKLRAAIKEYRELIEMLGPWPAFVSAMSCAYALNRQPKKAHEGLAQLREIKEKRYYSPYLEGVVHAALGDNDTACTLFEKSAEEKSSWLTFLGVDPLISSLRDEARVKALMRQVNIFSPGRARKSSRGIA